ncbi:hypothetical protein EA462_09800 [Natrarchaeobius halalkaliphilus]|uniref:Uncharacterized protein n=2 Tax=Natrarchaeobius halalkaliphilus TaxID=1679091 RepID=A0A3N6LME6_9EURY|nr:hypothetical protein EA462_09800 [Natrarchaeobius halalkaliphilus]
MTANLTPRASTTNSTDTGSDPLTDSGATPSTDPSSSACTTDVLEPFPYRIDETASELPSPSANGVLRSDRACDTTGVAGRLSCPACGEATVNGAGLFTCVECSWDGSLR